MTAQLQFIGEISTPYQTLEQCPNNIQANGPLCTITVNDKYKNGLLGLKQGQHILILYWLSGTNRNIMQQSVNTDKLVKGTFALRSPHRPNPIGAAVLPIEKIEDGYLIVKGLDCLDKTQLLDIKPALRHE